MGDFGTFEGQEILVSRLNIGAFTIPLETVQHKGDELLLLVRVKVGEVGFPPLDSPTRVHKAKVVNAAPVPDDQREPLETVLSDAVDARDGVARLASDGPDWLKEPVEMGDGPAKAKRGRRKDLPEPIEPEGTDG